MAATLRTVQKLAAAVNVSRRTVAEWLARPDWPPEIPRKAPWTAAHLAAIKAWRGSFRHDAGDDAEPSGFFDADGKPLTWDEVWQRERALKAKLDREEREGKLMPAKLLEPALKALATLFVRELDNAFRALPLQLAGLEAGQIEKILADRFRTIRTRIAAQQALELEKIREAPRAKRGKKRGRKPRK